MQFPHILVINLKERTDRWKSISEQLNKEGLPYERVEAIVRKEGWKGCSLSHKKAISIAKERGYPWVLILEDDCLFEHGWKQRFEELLPILWKRQKEWEVFSGGSYVVHKACKLEDKPPLFQITAWSAHFMLIPAHTYLRILRYRLHLSIDDTYRRNYRIWCTYPHLAIQTGGWSNIRKHRNKPSTFRKQFGKQNKLLHTLKQRCGKDTETRKATLKDLQIQIYRHRQTRKIPKKQRNE